MMGVVVLLCLTQAPTGRLSHAGIPTVPGAVAVYAGVSSTTCTPADFDPLLTPSSQAAAKSGKLAELLRSKGIL